jgi:hypothetical protein
MPTGAPREEGAAKESAFKMERAMDRGGGLTPFPAGLATLPRPSGGPACLQHQQRAAHGCPSMRRRSWREASDPARAPGTATRKEVRRAAGARALVARSATLRRSLPRPRPADVGYRLGSARGVACWASVEDSVLVLGPPRSGKGLHLVVPMVLDAPGAVVTTSTRPDNLALTLAKRSGRGPVMVFDPQGLDGPPAHAPVLHWSLTRGCEAGQVAMARAEALVPSAGSAGVENSNFWRAQALSATRCLLHAAALDGRPPADREERSAATKGRCRTWRSTSGTARSRGRASESGSRWVQFGLPGQRPPAGQRSRAGTRAITSRSRRSRQRART